MALERFFADGRRFRRFAVAVLAASALLPLSCAFAVDAHEGSPGEPVLDEPMESVGISSPGFTAPSAGDPAQAGSSQIEVLSPEGPLSESAAASAQAADASSSDAAASDKQSSASDGAPVEHGARLESDDASLVGDERAASKRGSVGSSAALELEAGEGRSASGPSGFWKRTGSSWSYLDALSGRPRVGLFRPDGSCLWYFSDAQGNVRTGWIDHGGQRYFANPEGDLVSGFHSISGTWYYFDSSKEGGPLVRAGEFSAFGHKRMAQADGSVVHGSWAGTDDRSFWSNDKGRIEGPLSFVRSGNRYLRDGSGRVLSGWTRIADRYYYANPQRGGALARNFVTVGSGRYYCDPKTGVMRTGWLSIGGRRYLTDGGGLILTGFQNDRGTWYYFDGDGAMQTGWVRHEGHDYYLFDNGVLATDTSIRVSDGTYWYVDSEGKHNRQAGIDRILKTARSLLGVPYVWLGVYPKDGGMDCASFTWYLYKQIGIDIGFETYDQRFSGVKVDSAQPGDIVLMYYGGWPKYDKTLPEHVVLYAGDSYIYEEPDFGGHCQYVTLASKRAWPVTIRRILS
ncbi:NlpC/P60 family protein [Gordonibacter sp. Marseille-P4307]|uniref:C40 family peptidase n=1 Tax=Gordonibacter sp. Marseille-P4307 TaxID=2161815 RepID=UPI000F52BC09|nr:NlpC/P60 family protein [Gordonibacter sp. Marseille-P4307]